MNTLKFMLLTACFIITASSSYCQDWTKQRLDKNNDSIFAIYSWDASNQYHSAWGVITLFKNSRYQYLVNRPFNGDQYSEGVYFIKKNNLILNSDIQPGGLKVKADYIDSISTDSNYVRIGMPKNSNGVIIENSYYYINDTAAASFFAPYYPFTRHLLDTMRTLKICFDNNDFTTSWIPIYANNKFVQITILSDKDFNVYENKVFTNVKFLIKRKGLVGTTFL